MSIGISLCPRDSRDVESILRNADLAMGRRVVALEALVRWRHPKLGLIPPGKFISIAEESGLILPLGEYILRSVCEQVVSWQQAGVPVVPVAVNWSAIQLASIGRGSRVSCAAGIGMSPRLLSLEITEGALLKNLQKHAVELQALRNMGVCIQIDDFGTGYSSFSYLRELPVDSLKIDRSFITHVAENAADQAIVSAILAMARGLGLRVIAEGVETAAQLEVLSRYGCEVTQAFFFSRPLPANECRALLEELAVRPSFTETLRMRVKLGLSSLALPLGDEHCAEVALFQDLDVRAAENSGDTALYKALG